MQAGSNKTSGTYLCSIAAVAAAAAAPRRDPWPVGSCPPEKPWWQVAEQKALWRQQQQRVQVCL